ncbi:bifunctional nuclease family protein [Parabacteroides sp. OttesenSCG-928-N08]|nr:bifunctional nuclease family protein [Parabacteroides sp. OttesenSCG-928-N08]
METKVKLRVQGLTNSQIQSGAYALILAEEKGLRRIPIIVGTAEAQSIAIALEQIKPPRPLTHDLFIAFNDAFGIYVREVYIYRFEDGIFYSELVLNNNEQLVRIDSRTSDAIAIALRVNCDIYTTERIMRECAVVLEEEAKERDVEEEEEDLEDLLIGLEPEDIEDEEKLKIWLRLLDDEELHTRLADAIEKEKYEYAKMYKDEIKRREE